MKYMCYYDDDFVGGERDRRRRERFVCKCREVRDWDDRDRERDRERFICRCREVRRRRDDW